MLKEIFVEKKWGAGLCAFLVYAVLFFLFNIAILLLALVPKLYLVITSRLSLTIFIFFCIFTCWISAAALFTGWSIYWFFKRNYACFRPLCKTWIFMQLFYISAVFDGKLLFLISLLLGAMFVAFVCLLNRYVDKSKALKRYFGEE